MGLMFRRRRPVARLAVGAAEAGVAYHAGQTRAEHDQNNQETAAAYTTNETEPPPPQYVAPAPASTGGEVDELSRLAQMHESGALTDDEFVAAKGPTARHVSRWSERRTAWAPPLPLRQVPCAGCSTPPSPATVRRWRTS